MDIATSTAEPTLSAPFVERLCVAYHAAIAAFVGHGDSMWASFDIMRVNIHDAFIACDIALLQQLLTQPLTTRLYCGVDELYDHGEPLSEANRLAYADMARTNIEAMAVALGATRALNPEGGELYIRGALPPMPAPDALLEAIERLFGVTIDFPNPFDGESGLATARGISTVRAAAAIYQALRLRMLCGEAPGQPVLEIGGGMGRTAYYANRFGMTDYAIVDLPLTLIGQAVFLALTLGEQAVRFAEEADTAAPPGGRITLLTPAQFHRSETRWGVVLNADSMPEMDREHAAAYIARMQGDGALWLSINHEANRTAVQDLAPAAQRLWRGLYALRQGYLEELYDFRPG